MRKNFSIFLSVIVSLFFLSATASVFADEPVQTVKAVTPNPSGLVARYEFEGNPADSSGFQPAANGTLLGNPIYASGVFGRAISMDGEGDYVDFGNGPSFNITSQITVAVWIKVNQFDKPYQAVVTKGDNSWRIARAGATNNVEFACNGTAAAKWNGKGEVPWAVIGTTNVNDGKWHHIAGIFDGSALYLYIDGVLESAKAAAKSIDISNYDVCIGANSQAPGRDWNGLIDDVRIYNYALSQDEIISVMGKSEINFSESLPATLFKIAKRYDGLKKYEEAKGVCQLILQRHPDSLYASNAQIYISKRDIVSLIEAKKYDEVQTELDKLMADFGKHPDLPEALYTIAGGYSNAKKFKGAEDVYKQLIEMFPDSPYAEKARFRAPKIHIFYLIASGKFDEVQAAIDKFVADFLDNPDVPGIIYWFAKELELSKEYEKAKSVYQQVAFDYPDNPHSIKAQLGASKIDALLFIESEQDTAAQKTLDNLIANFRDNPDLPEVILLIGEEYFNKALNGKGKPNLPEAKPEEYYRKALAVWERIVTELPKSAITPEAYFFSTRCYHLLGEYEKAIGCCKIIVDNWPHYQYAGDAQFLIGECYEHLCQNGNISENEANQKIIKVYSGLVDTYPDFAKLDEVLLKLGWLTLKGGDFTAAEEFFARALERFPEGYKPKDALYALARIYQKNGKYTKSEQAYTKLLEYIEPDSPEAEKVIAMIAQVKQLQN